MGVVSCLLVTAIALLVGAQGPARAGSLATADQGKPPLPNPDYRGKLIGDANGRILIRVSGGKARIQLRNLDDVCEDGIDQTTYFAGLAPIDDGGRFTSLISFGPADSSNNVFFNLVTGHMGKKSSYGEVFSMGDVYDPPGSGTTYDECWSDGVVRWRADAVGGGSTHPPQPPDTDATAIRPGTYSGHTYRGSFTLSIKRQASGSGLKASVGGHLRLFCDAPSEPTARLRYGFSVRGRHPLEYLSADASPGYDRSVFWIVGRPGGSDKLHGKLAYFEDPWDPEGTTNRPECGTATFDLWSAKRIGP